MKMTRNKTSEEMNIDEPFESICRLCADMTSTNTFIPLYTADKQEQIVTKQINQLIINLISPNDGLPQEICLQCAENVAKYYAFVTNIIETQNKLRRIIQLPEIKRINHMNNSQTQFLQHDQFETEIDDDVTQNGLKNDNKNVNENENENENETNALFNNAEDDFVELLVVHPDEMVEMNINNILKTEEGNDTSCVSYSTNSPVILIKEEDFVEGDGEISEKKESPERLFLEVDENIIEAADQEIDWSCPEESGELQEDVKVLHGCSACGKTYDSEKEYRVHACVLLDDERNVKRKDFQCELCSRIFKSRFLFQMHLAQHKKTSVCPICDAYFSDNNCLMNHISEDHPQLAMNIAGANEDNFSEYKKQCDICGKITDNLKQHKMYHTIKELEYCKEENKRFLKKWFYCQKCNKKIFSEANFLFHEAKHEGKEVVQCKQCKFVAKNVQEYNMHITSHTGGKYFICDSCDKCFFTRSAISDHVLIHMEGSRYMCEICGKRFKTSRSNAQHKLLQHKKYFRCNRCNRGFTHEAKLNSHYNICQVINQEPNDSREFEPVEKFFCNICNSNIKSSSDISILFHKAKHEGKEGVECRYCNLLCKNACMYKNHLLIHTNQRPYNCTQCPKSFRTKGCLVQHMLVHGDEYKYTCEYCGKKSKKLTTHINHVNIHTDTKPYNCPDCDRPFRQLSDMKKHRRTHLKYKGEPISINSASTYGVTVKTEMEEIIAVDSIQHIQLV